MADEETGTPATTSKYRFLREVAKGGMGRVELALRHQGTFRRIYAVKRLREAYLEDPDVRNMFLDEARIAGLIQHPNVVGVIDVGEDDQGPFLVMDFIRGISVSELLAWVRERGELLPVQLCARVVAQIAEGLHAAHELRGGGDVPLSVVHRDVSPQNILLGFDGIARITDFGIAKALGRLAHTSTGILKGKFGYVSPEQLKFRELDRRSDLFSLGVVFYELLAGDRLYREKDGVAAARRILDEPPPDIDDVRKDVHPSIVELLFRMMAKEPDARPPTAEDVAERLGSVVAELVGIEGTLSLKDFLEEHFGDRRLAQQREIDELARQPGRAPTIEVKTPDLAVHDASTRMRRSGRRFGLAVLVIVGAGLGIAAAVVATRTDDTALEPSNDAPEAVAAPPPADPATPEQPDDGADPVEGPETETVGQPVEESPPPEEAPAMDWEEPTARQRELRERRQRLRERRPRMRDAEMSAMTDPGWVPWGGM